MNEKIRSLNEFEVIIGDNSGISIIDKIKIKDNIF